MRLNGSALVDDQRGDARLIRIDELFDEFAQIEPSSRHRDNARAVTDEEVEPDARDV